MAGAGRKELQSIRLRAEATPGARGTPRFILRANGDTIDDQREVTFVESRVGHFGGTDETYIAKLMAELPLAETEATFEQLPDLLMMCGLGTFGGGNWAGSAQGGSGSSVAFTLITPDTSYRGAHPTYTVEAGDDAWAEYMPYTLCKELELSFAGGEAVKVSATLFGQFGTATNAEGSFSAAGTLVQVETILAGNGSFWLTPAGSSWGTGAVTAGNILAGNLKLTPKWTPKFSVDAGKIYFHTAVYTGMDIEGELTLEHQISGTYGAAGSAGQVEKWRAQDAQLLEMRWAGGAISEGTTYANKELDIKLPIKWSVFEPLDEMDGNDIRVGQFVSKFPVDTPTVGRGTFLVVRRGTSEFAGA